MATEKAGNQPSDIEQLRADIEKIRQDMAALVNDAGHAAGEGMRHAASSAREHIHAAGNGIEETFENGRDAVRREIVRNPFLIVAGTFLAGVLIGRTLSS